MKRQGNTPKRRFAPINELTEPERVQLANTVRYEGSGHHKRSPADYGLARTNPRPTKSLCDLVKVVRFDEALELLSAGILWGMFSRFSYGQFPKFVWCVDQDGEVYEAKTTAATPGTYHGYRLEEDDDMRGEVMKQWKLRCPEAGR